MNDRIKYRILREVEEILNKEIGEIRAYKEKNTAPKFKLIDNKAAKSDWFNRMVYLGMFVTVLAIIIIISLIGWDHIVVQLAIDLINQDNETENANL